MIRLPLVILSLLIPLQALANAAVFEEKSMALDTSLSLTTSPGAFTSACPIGATVEAYVVWKGTTAPSGVADSASQSYTAKASTYDSNSDVTLALYVLQNNQSNTALTVMATWAANQYNKGLWEKCITGVSTASYQTSVGNSQINPGTTSNAVTSTSITPSSQPALVSSVSAITGNNSSGLAAGTGFNSGISGFGSGTGGLSESERITSTSALSATYTDATGGSANDYTTVAAIYSEATTTARPSQFFLGQ